MIEACTACGKNSPWRLGQHFERGRGQLAWLVGSLVVLRCEGMRRPRLCLRSERVNHEGVRSPGPKVVVRRT